ncbi:hypothetical protein [Streptomyces sp. CA-111067]|uniref:hypothetical protein n=1 Tax=Streptomyces sp. CA-111067 TaxID=3240046 RepID=UPI003D9A075B
MRGVAELVRRRGAGLAQPDFARGQLATAGWAAGPLALALVALLVPRLRTAVLAPGALLGAYVLARSFLLIVFERLQHAYEPRWLADQTAALRGHDFPLLRCAVRDDEGPAADRVYDLTSGEQVGELVDRREAERAGGTSRATLEFGCAAAATSTAAEPGAVAEVRRPLRELELRPGGARQASVRFPQARYVPLPGTGPRPARRAYWVLSGPVLVSGAEATARTGSAR